MTCQYILDANSLFGGSWFVLERWISESPFKHAKPPGQSDLDVAHGPHAKITLEHHWDTWIQESDWDWLVEQGINCVRIPVSQQPLQHLQSCSDALAN